MNSRLCCIGLLAGVAAHGFAAAQSQTTYNRLDDLGDNTVQTFVTEQSASFGGVSLLLKGHGSGRDVTVQVRRLLYDGRLSTTVVAEGTLAASEISTSTPEWRYIQFDSPVQVMRWLDYGLVLTHQESTSSGYVDYGTAIGNPYGEGRIMHEGSPGAVLSLVQPNLDLAFENIYTTFEPIRLRVDPAAETITATGSFDYTLDHRGQFLLTSGNGIGDGSTSEQLSFHPILRALGGGPAGSEGIYLADDGIGLSFTGTKANGLVTMNAVDGATVSYAMATDAQKAYLESAAAGREVLHVSTGRGAPVQVVLVPEPSPLVLLGLGSLALLRFGATASQRARRACKQALPA